MRIGKEEGMERVRRSNHTEGAAGGEGRVRTKLGVDRRKGGQVLGEQRAKRGV